MRERYRFVVVGYVVMPEHIHVLISEPEHGTPSTVVQAIKLGFARRVLGPRKVAVAQTLRGVPHVSRFLRDVGDDHKDVSAEDIVHHRIWQRRFYDFNVWTARKRPTSIPALTRGWPQLRYTLTCLFQDISDSRKIR